MADSYTPNLGLVKPEIGSSDEDWGDKLNANADKLDALFGSKYAGNPNGFVAGTYVGQRVYDTVNRITWTCRLPGNAASAIWTASGKAPLGTVRLFRGADAPLGWSILNTAGFDQATLRLRASASVGTGGTLDFTAAFAAGFTTGAHALTVDELPAHVHSTPSHQHSIAHTHTVTSRALDAQGAGGAADPNLTLTAQTLTGSATTSNASPAVTADGGAGSTGAVGDGDPHDHDLPDRDVMYVDVQFCERTA